MDGEPEGRAVRPEDLPFYAEWPEEDWGKIIYAEQSCPGVYYLNTRLGDHLCGGEYYVVLHDADAISDEARAYGTEFPDHSDFRLFPCQSENGGREIIEYEVEKFRLGHDCKPQKGYTLHDGAIFGMELYPQYFGEYPVPFETPMGYTCRHKRIDNGVYWIETDWRRHCLAVCYPYQDELSSFSQKLAAQMKTDQEKGLEQTLGYLFFEERACCIPIFELMELREWDQMIDKAALMNAIWKDFPEYAAAYNADEQSGQHDILGLIRISLGDEDIKLQGSVEQVISITPDAGTSFFRFQQT